MIAPNKRYHHDEQYTLILFDHTDEEQARLLDTFLTAFQASAVRELLTERYTVLRLYPGVPEARS